MDPPLALRILAAAMCIVIVARMLLARRGKDYFIRRIPGIDAVEETVGRATETGRPVLFSPGMGAFDNMQTIAGLAVMAWVARRCVQMSVRMLVAIAEPVVISAADNILFDAFRQEGRESEYRASDVFFFGRDENAYAAGVIGLLTREKVAAAYYFGGYGFETLLMAETGNRVGAIQVAATADFFQIPFFLCACDYTLIGEELYAASAYLSRDPIQVGGVSGQDFAKAILLAIIIAGSLAALWLAFFGKGGAVLNPVEGILGR